MIAVLLVAAIIAPIAIFANWSDAAAMDELEAWLNARLDERLLAERKTMLEMVIKLVAFLFDEHIQRDGEAHGRELEQLSAKIQASFDRIEGVLEQQADRIDRAARGEPLDRMN